MPQHRVNRHVPLILEARGQLLHLLLRRHRGSPHLLPRRLDLRVSRDQAVVAHLVEAQPRQVPAAVAVRIRPHARMRVVDDVGADGVVAREVAQLNQQLVAGDVVHPRRRHGLLEGLGVGFVLARGGDAFDAAEFREGVDAVVLERLDDGLDRGLKVN